MTSCSTGLVTNSTPVRKRQIPLASSTEDHERSAVSHLKPKSWESTASAYIGLGATQKHHSQGWYPKHHGHMVATSQQKYSILSASTSHASLDGTAHEAHPTARTCATTTGECYHFLLRVVQSKPTSVPKMDRKWRGKRWLHQCFTILPSYCSMASLFPCGGHSRCRCLGSEFFSLWEILRSGRFRFSFSKAARRCHLPSFSSLEFASHFWCDQRRCMA